MIYKLLKKSLGIARIDSIFEVNLDFSILDTCYVPNFGFFFLTKNTHCLGLVSLSGKLEFPWVGQINEKGDKNGITGLFDSPSSLCYSLSGNKIIIIDSYGKRIRSVELESRYINTSIQGVEVAKINRYFSKINTTESSCSIDSKNNIYWTARDVNRVFKFNTINGDIDVCMGSGKSGFSVGSNLKQCLLSKPNGIRCSNNTIFVCDSGNYCIRAITGESSYILAGKPMIKGDEDDIGIKSLLSYPNKLRINYDVIYFADSQKLKVISLNDKKVITVREFEKDFFIECDKHLYMLEQL